MIPNILSWFGGYLTGLSSIVKFGGDHSDPLGVKSGVSKGSLLGPNLYNLFENVIEKVIEFEFLLFADDIKFVGGG